MVRVAAMVAAALLAFIACYDKPAEPLRVDGAAGTGGDGARPIDAATGATPDAKPACSLVTIADFGTTEASCPSGFGGVSMGTGVVASATNGTLNFALSSTPGSTGSCTTTSQLSFAGGVRVQAVTVPSVNATSSWVSMRFANGTFAIKVVLKKSGTISTSVSCNGGPTTNMALTLTEPFWVRERGDGGTPETVVVEVSNDGVTYQMVGSCMLAEPAATAFVELGAASGSGATSVASFDNLEACP